MMKKLFRLVVATLILMPIAYADQTLITNVHVWDGVAEQLSEKTSVMINGNLIRKIGRVDGDVGDGVKKIDGGGRTLMPGLINSHVHLTHTMATGGITGFEMMTWEEIGAVAASSAKEYLMNGFTTVRDMGGMADGFKRAIDNGLLEGPRIYAAGAYISQTSGHADLRLRSQPNAQLTGVQYSNLERLNIIRVADGVPNILTAVRDNFANGAAYIKIHAGGGIASERDPLHTVQYTPEELSAANSAVRNWNTYWTVHAYSSDSVNQALDAGALCIVY